MKKLDKLLERIGLRGRVKTAARWVVLLAGANFAFRVLVALTGAGQGSKAGAAVLAAVTFLGGVFLIGFVALRVWGPKRHAAGDYASDIRTAGVATGQDYDPAPYWNPEGGVFLGLSTNPGQPVAVPERLFKERHMQIVGPTGSGKGKLLGNLAAQAIRAGNTLVVIDPKRDRYLPHIVADFCAGTGRTLHVVDLKERTPGGWHPFKAGRREDRLSRIVECFDLTPRGTDADFYKVQGKELLTRMVAATDGTIGAAVAWLEADAKGFKGSEKPPGSRERSHFATWQGRRSLNPEGDGFDLNRALGRGEVVYLRSDPTDPELVIPLKAFLMQVAQWKFARPNTRHLTVLADEASLYASTYLAHLLATIRDTGTNLVLAYQSLSDLESAANTPAEGRIIRQRIDQNCQLKVFYGTNDNLTVEEVALMSGTRRVQIRTEERRKLGGYSAESRIDSKEALIPENVIRRLPERVAVYFEPSQVARTLRTAPVRTSQTHDFAKDERFYGG